MKKTTIILLTLALHLSAFAQGWPYEYEGVMMQGFYWDSYDETSWSKLQAQADEIAPYFQLIWVPQSGWCNSDYNTMGYMPVYYFNQNSSFGTERELRNMIAAYRDRGTGFIADVVVNHRSNIGTNGSWTDFPAETYNGVTYQMGSTDVCKNDDGGATAGWASGQGLSLSINDDTGEDWSGCRDLDHKNPNVQNCIKAYLKFLLEDIGYVGFRYDMVKGFWASFIADYNMYAKPKFSVGEYFDGTSNIRTWVNNTKGYVSDTPTSAAFDFGFRYRVRDAIDSHNWRNLGWDEKPLAELYEKQYAVTFVENHDTEHRISGEVQTPIWRDTLAANAYLLAMPGTPCVFYRHWKDCKYQLKQMILARRLAGITNISGVEEKWTDDNFYAKAVYGKRGTLLCVVGTYPYNYNASSTSYQEILSGKGYRYLLSRSMNTVWMDVPDGRYEAPLEVKFTAVTNLSNTKIVYTLDGSEPTTDSPQVANGGSLSITSSCTLKAAILSGGKVYDIQSRKYDIFEPHDITIHVHSDVTWSGMTFYVWDNTGKQLTTDWPGKHVTTNETIDGKRWYHQTYRLTSPDQYINLVVSNISKNRQTVNVTGIRQDCYLVITGDKEGTKYIIEDQSKDMETGILSPNLEIGNDKSTDSKCFDLSGRMLPNNRKHQGIYIRGGKKYLNVSPSANVLQ
ncbi:MAG: chitobiase/beta-hexosaminidase C-terminal domain-containing protein [Bacteroidaceae bacterium]|nr:chitobiase/beta-hexosaminidase C-terminal domain-containing protein [Bacteroidaceae bacterium]